MGGAKPGNHAVKPPPEAAGLPAGQPVVICWYHRVMLAGLFCLVLVPVVFSVVVLVLSMIATVGIVSTLFVAIIYHIQPGLEVL